MIVYLLLIRGLNAMGKSVKQATWGILIKSARHLPFSSGRRPLNERVQSGPWRKISSMKAPGLFFSGFISRHSTPKPFKSASPKPWVKWAKNHHAEQGEKEYRFSFIFWG